MNADNLLACPRCKAPDLARQDAAYRCPACETQFRVAEGVPVFIRPDAAITSDQIERAEFWDAGWEKRNAPLLALDGEGVRAERERYLDELTKEGYPSAVDIGPDDVAGKTFLNIGCGGGYEGLLFAGYGAGYIGVDFSHNAARYTGELINKAGYEGITYQAEAEALPFRDDSMDFIYSSGVLHHTPNTEDALKEVLRVLKPGGTAMIGLYATHSIMFGWYRLHAVARGNLTAGSIQDWLNANTEGEWQTDGRVNRWTATYTRPEFYAMLTGAGFSAIRIRQTPKQIKNIPIIGKIVRRVLPPAVGDRSVGSIGGMLMATCSKELPINKSNKEG